MGEASIIMTDGDEYIKANTDTAENLPDDYEKTTATTVDFLREKMLSALARSEALGEVKHGWMTKKQEEKRENAFACVDNFTAETEEEARRFVLEFHAEDLQKGHDWKDHPWTEENDYGPSSAEDLINLSIVRKINQDARLRELAGTDAIHDLCKRLFDKYRAMIRKKNGEQPGDHTTERETISSHMIAPAEYDIDEWDSDSYVHGARDESIMINLIMKEIARYGNTQTIDEILDITTNEEFSVTKHAAWAFSHIDADYAAEKMLARLSSRESQELANSSGREREARRDLSRILYRLEFGRVGISEQGLTYLGKLYDLGEHNNPDFFARRLSASGDMGIFDDDKRLQNYINLGDVGDGRTFVRAAVLDFTLDQFFSRPAQVGSPEREEQEQVLAEFKTTYFDFLESEFFDGTDIQFNNLTFREQAWFMKFALNADEDTRLRARAFALDHGETALKIFMALEMDRQAGEKILDLHEQLSAEQMSALIYRYGEALYRAETLSADMADTFGSDTGLGPEDIFEGLMIRAKDVLATTHAKIKNGDDKDTVVRDAIEQMAKESPKEQVVSGQFRKLAEVLRDKDADSVDLKRYMAAQEAVASESSGLYKHALHERGELKPIPEIHWRVDRGLDEYKRRFGFDVVELLERLAEPDRKKILLEFGPGSGQSKAERAARGLSDHYMDVAMADTVYYPLNGFIRNMIDWSALDRMLDAKLTERDKDNIADLLYKTMMIEDGQTAQDDFAYCAKRMETLTKNPSAIVELLTSIAPQLESIDTIPTNISTRDESGKVLYPYKIDLSAEGGQSVEFLAAKHMLSQNMETFLRQESAGSVFDAIPAHPEGIMVGDFSEIAALRDEQIDVAVGVRSTVFITDSEEYVDFMLTMADKLAEGGLYVDDNVRDLDAWYYRVAELLRVRKSLEEKNGADTFSFSILVGPGFEGQDHRQDEVPLAVLMGKDKDYSKIIGDLLDTSAGYKIISLHDYAIDFETLKSLDATGHVAETVKKGLS